jgi:hypothetical protein
MDANEHEDLKRTADGRRFTQIRLLLCSSRGSLVKVGRWMGRLLIDLTKEMNELHPEIYNRELLGKTRPKPKLSA